MSRIVNIRRDVDDAFYRYKMPTLVCKVEGKGNGIKTVLVNMSDVAKALDRPPRYPSKFFGAELGTQVKIDDKKNHYVINGKHDADHLQNLLDVFIDKFVLCQSCKNPETKFEFTKDDDITKDCKACGAHTSVDMRHKLVSYILKNKPEVDKNDKYRKNNERAASAENSDDEGVPVDDQLAQDLAALPTAEDLGVDDNDWAVDTSVEAVKERMKELAVKLPGEPDNDDDMKGTVDEFADFITEGENFPSDQEIFDKADFLELRDDKACAILVQVLFNELVIKEKQIEQRTSLLAHFAKSEKAQKGLLGGFERLVIALYDCDLVEESVFLAWDEKASKKFVDKKEAKKVREHAKPFTQWLREAESEEEED